MLLRRQKLNILLFILDAILGVWAACIYRRPPLVLSSEMNDDAQALVSPPTDSIVAQSEMTPIPVAGNADTARAVALPPIADRERVSTRVEATRFKDTDLKAIMADHPFRKEALKVLNGHLGVADSASRHRILSYCEHLRSSYTTRDIDFIRQVFSDNALIIVGHVVKSGANERSGLSSSEKVTYSLRTKQSYIEKLARIFDSKKDIDVKFSDFRIMRHPTIEGVYGVTLKQRYSCDSYSDEGWLFLLWDFRNISMPLIHVRTWQPASSVENVDDELIGIYDFNLE